MSDRASQVTMSLSIATLIGRSVPPHRLVPPSSAAGRSGPARRIASIVVGSSSADRSPGSRPSQAARTTRRMILPERVFGRAGTTATASGLSVLPRSSTTRREIAAAERPRRRSRPRRSVQTTTIVSPLIACGTPIAAASTTRGMGRGRGLDLGRPDALAGDLERVVRAAADVPVAVVVDDRPVAVDPDAREAAPVRLDVALAGRARSRGSCPAAAPGSRARRPRRAAAGPPGRRRPPRCPMHGPLNDAGLIGLSRLQPTIPPRDLRPARVVDDRAAARRRPRGSTTTSSPDPTARRSSRGRAALAQVVGPDRLAPCGISARTTVGRQPEVGDPVAARRGPEPVGPGVVRRALVEHQPRAEQQRRRRSPTGPSSSRGR